MLFGRLPFPLAASEASLVDAPHATSPWPAKGGADDEDTGDKASARGESAAEAAAEAAGLVSSTELLISIAAGARLGESDSDDDDGGEVAILPDGTVTAIRDRPQDPASLATLASRSTSFLGAAATIERAIRTQPLRFPTAGVTSAAAASPSTGAVSADAVSGAAGARTDGGPSVIQEALLAATSSDTVRRKIFSGKPARLLKSRWTDAWDADDAPQALPMPLQNVLVSEAHQRMSQSVDPTTVAMPVGQIVGRMNEIRPVADIMAELVSGFDEATGRLDGFRDH
jgi:hypothetical protein